MHVTRQKEDYNAITYELFKTKNLSFKFKTKIYNEFQAMDGSITESFFHKEYVYNKGKKRKGTIALSTKSYIQIDIFNPDSSTKDLFFMSESMMNKFVRKNKNIVTILEAYDDHEIEIISIDSSGTHISNNVPKTVSTVMGRGCILTTICIMEDKSSVGVEIQFDSFNPVIIPAYLFLELYYTLSNINFTSCGISLLTYLGTANLGTHEQDFRESGFIEKTETTPSPVQKFTGSTMSDFNNIKNPQTLKPSTNKLVW